jgi:putative Holliday junction resolvase
MRILGIDHGERKIGLALSDETALLARPLTILAHTSAAEDAAAIARIAAAENAGRIVVGLPLDSDGREGHQARRVRRWAEVLRDAAGLPLEFWDESFSTATVAAYGKANKSRRKKGRASGKAAPAGDDAAAAAVILQDYLDAQRNAPAAPPQANA